MEILPGRVNKLSLSLSSGRLMNFVNAASLFNPTFYLFLLIYVGRYYIQISSGDFMKGEILLRGSSKNIYMRTSFSQFNIYMKLANAF